MPTPFLRQLSFPLSRHCKEHAGVLRKGVKRDRKPSLASCYSLFVQRPKRKSLLPAVSYAPVPASGIEYQALARGHARQSLRETAGRAGRRGERKVVRASVRVLVVDKVVPVRIVAHRPAGRLYGALRVGLESAVRDVLRQLLSIDMAEHRGS